MNTHRLRIECDKGFPDGSDLRKLASDITSLEWAEAKQHGLLTANPAPYNLLANGETGSGWICPAQISSNDLIAWKKAANGFAGSTHRGLSLLFDPFVDACLLNVSIKDDNGEGTFPQSTKVLVLTDYYPLKHVVGEMSALPGQDWAAVETENFQNARNLGLTGNNLFKALFADQRSIKEVRMLGQEGIIKKFADERLLIWNYFPFMRGGSDCEGMSGLPKPSDCSWISYCDNLLLQLLHFVNASHVLFAMNQQVKEARSNCQCVPNTNDVLKSEGISVHSIAHPRSWLDRLGDEAEKFRNFVKG
ncbi:MAG: hypothetical protein M3R59_00020 [Verrucomicrobiota bacterium]|nr:hypothetical protein [Verrucomicrobiota bacterium]